MRRLCERPGCSGPASVSYGMDADERLVWIDSEPAVDPARAGALCRRHADALRPPRGWILDDRRDDVPRLLRVPENPTPTPRRTAPRRDPVRPTRRRSAAPAEPDLFAEQKWIVPDTSTSEDVPTPDESRHGRMTPAESNPAESTPVEPSPDEPTPDETKAIPWVPRLGAGVGGEIPRGRLLGRAFGRRDDGD